MLRGLLTRKGRTWRWSRNLSRKPGGSWPDVVPWCVFCFLPAGPVPPCSLHFILYSQALFLFNSFSLIGLLREWCIMVATLLQSIPSASDFSVICSLLSVCLIHHPKGEPTGQAQFTIWDHVMGYWSAYKWTTLRLRAIPSPISHGQPY